MGGIAIGIAGTAKNTGKTTTTSAIIEGLNKKGIGFGLTGIGYDGELLDNVTGLPKPRLTLLPGQLVATAERCLKASTAKLEVFKTTDIITPLGKVLYCRVKEKGQVLIAGPNKSKELKRVIADLKNEGTELILVDGALNRMAPMVATDGFILATGAARQPDIDRLVLETKAISQICELKPYIGPSLKDYGSVTFITRTGEFKASPVAFLFNKNDVKELASYWQNESLAIYIPGVVGEKCWPDLVKLILAQEQKPTLIFQDPIKILIAGNFTKSYNHLKLLIKHGVQVSVEQPVKLFAVTVNPFYPKYRYEASDYEPAYIDKTKLLNEFKNQIRIPVFDVLQDGGKVLLDMLL